MPRTRPHTLVAMALMMMAAAIVLWPTPVSAQCGTQASSCKNCHEVQAAAPVNTKGDWHIQHAFGDFCEFCHAGNVTATDKEAAHQGLIYPLNDTKANCSSCHAKDYDEKAGLYAKTLGVDLKNPPGGSSGLPEAGSGAASSGAQSPTPAQPSNQGNAPAASAPESSAQTSDQPQVDPAAVNTQGGQILDLKQSRPAADGAISPIVALPSTGDLILTVLLIVLLAAFAALIWHFEGLGKRWAELRGTTLQPAYARASIQGSPALEALKPSLEQANPATLAALNRLLEGDPVRGGQMIEALARINPRLVEAVRRLSDSDLELLVALVRDLNARG